MIYTLNNLATQTKEYNNKCNKTHTNTHALLHYLFCFLFNMKHFFHFLCFGISFHGGANPILIMTFTTVLFFKTFDFILRNLSFRNDEANGNALDDVGDRDMSNSKSPQLFNEPVSRDSSNAIISFSSSRSNNFLYFRCRFHNVLLYDNHSSNSSS